MSVWVVAADSSRARIFSSESRIGPLSEIEDLVHPASREREQGLVSDAPGRGRARPVSGGVGHSVGHEDDAKADEAERFARSVAQALCAGRRAGRFERLHLLAAPAFLGRLRRHLDDDTRGCVASERDANVTHETAAEIRGRLPERL